MSSDSIEIRLEKNLNNLIVVQNANRGERGEFFVVAFLAILMVVGCLVYGWQHYQHRELGYRIEAANKERVRLNKTNETLLSERQTYRGSDRITELAKQLGLTAPEPGQVRSVTAVESASPTPALQAQQ